MMHRFFLIVITPLLLFVSCVQSTISPLPTPSPTDQSSLLSTPTIDPASVRGFDIFLNNISTAPTEDRNWMVSQYLVNEPVSPMIEDKTAIFIYQGRGNEIELRGDFNNWGNDGNLYMQRILGTDLWWYRGIYEPTARLDYILVVDDVEQIDRRNPLTINSEFGVRSVLKMKGYIDHSIDGETMVARGKLTSHQIDSEKLGQSRTFFVYEPATKLVGQSLLPSIYVHDGGDYLSLAGMQTELDRLIDARKIPPMIAIFIPPVDREIDYHNRAYRAFIANELMPFVQATYPVDLSAGNTGTMGVSLSGLLSLRLAIDYPTQFGLVVSHSGAFSLSKDNTPTMLENIKRLPFKIDLTVGTYETAVGVGGTADGNYLVSNRQIKAILAGKGYPYRYHEYPEGHSWGLWSAHISDALIYLYND